ncbi:MAG: hypothetical protein LBE49_02435 [Deltaproteobacteria bacterium]|jgi:uncharacterized protein YfaS (alpha-2-macroglobulin family)|nr:hypothetical protein [Deltaproteobacteria bacterium]
MRLKGGEELYGDLPEGEISSGQGPFDIVSAPPGSLVLYEGGGKFSLIAPLRRLELMAWLEESGPIALSWMRGLRPTLPGRALPDPIADPADLLSPDYLDLASFEKDGRLVTELRLPPFQGAWEARRGGDNLSVKITFNRRVSGGSGEVIDKSAFPLSFDPDPGLFGRWLDARTFELYTRDLTEEAYEAKVAGRSFAISILSGLKSLSGEDIFKISPGPAQLESGGRVILDPFRVLSFKASGFDPGGGVFVDLAFSKEVDKAALEAAAKFFLVLGQSGEAAEPFHDVSLVGVGRPGLGASRGRSARFLAKADNGALIRLDLMGLAAADGEGALGDKSLELKIVNDFLPIRHSAGVESRAPFRTFLDIEFTSSPAPLGFESKIKIEPETAFAAESLGWRGLRIYAAAAPERPLKVTLLKGLSGQRGVLMADHEFELAVPAARSPKLAFTGEGRYMTPALPMIASLTGFDADLVRLTAWKVLPENLPYVLLQQAGSGYPQAQFGLQLSSLEADIEAPLEDGKGRAFERSVDLASLLGGRKSGAFLLRAIPAYVDQRGRRRISESESLAEYELSPSSLLSSFERMSWHLPVVVTDLGLTARRDGSDIELWVLSLSTGKPAAGALVEARDLANRVVAQGLAEEDGLVRLKGAGRAAFLTARLNDDFSYLMLSDGLKDESAPAAARWYGGPESRLELGRGAQAEPLIRGYEAYLFSPRDVYKPGETAPVKAIVRDKRMHPPSAGVPLSWLLIDPQGTAVSQGTAELNLNGGLDFAASFPFSAKTGYWRAELRVPGESASIGRLELKVEDLAPPRLELSLSPSSPALSGSGPMPISGRAGYLFGAPGASLPFELSASAQAAAPGFLEAGPLEAFSAYDFSGLGESEAPGSWLLGETGGELGPEGELTWDLALFGEKLPPALRVRLDFEVSEDGGRAGTLSSSFDWYPRRALLGVKPPDEVMAGQKAAFSLAALSLSESAAPSLLRSGEAEIAVSLVAEIEYAAVEGGVSRLKRAEELTEVARARAAINDGLGEFSFTPKDSGLYEMAISGPEESRLRIRFRAGGLEGEKLRAESGEKLQISLDQIKYLPGGTVKAQLQAPFDGFAWLALETDKALWTKVAEVKGGVLNFDFKLPPEVVQNAFLTAVMARPVAPGLDNFLLAGEADVLIDPALYELAVEIELPEKISPSSKQKVLIRLKDPSGKPMAGEATVALADDGVARLTGYEISSPLKIFGRTRRALGSLSHLYGNLLPPPLVIHPFLAPGGGEGQGSFFSPFRREAEILTRLIPSVWVGASGEAEAYLDIPEFSGLASLTVVASNLERFGVAKKKVRISRELTVEPTLPLALAPGDEFTATVKIFLDSDSQNSDSQNPDSSESPSQESPSQESPSQASPSQASQDPSSAAPQKRSGPKMALQAEGPLSIVAASYEDGEEIDPAGFFPSLSPGQSAAVKIKMAARGQSPGSAVGPAKLLVAVEGQSPFTQSASTVVRPPYPRVARAFGGRLEEGSQKLSWDASGFLPGTAQGRISLASGPAAELARAVSYLSDYPYGCLEQTVSSAWPLLAAKDLGLSPESGDPGLMLDAAAARIATMRSFRGGFASWPGENAVNLWGSVYAAHFLTEARSRAALPEGLLEGALDYLRALLSENPLEGRYLASVRSAQAYAVFVLALNGEYFGGWINSLRDKPRYLTDSAKVFLAAALALREGNPRALLVLDEERSGENWPEGLASQSYESPSRNLSLRLLAWSLVDPLGERAALLAGRAAEDGRLGRWRTTQENAFAVIALTAYGRGSGTGLPWEAELFADGRSLLKASYREPASLGPAAVAPYLSQGLEAVVSGQGRPWYSLAASGVPLEAPAPESEGLSLSHRWMVHGEGAPAQEGSAAAWIALSSSEEDPPLLVRQGERVEAVLAIEAERPLESVVVSALFPGGFELVPGSAKKRVFRLEHDEDDDYHQGSPVRIEPREDRLVAVISELSGKMEIAYELRAVTPGRFILPPATAEGMYEPERRAVLAEGEVVVAPR